MKKLRHVVLFGFMDTTTQATIDTIITAFLNLQTKIPQIADMEWGTDVSIEGLQQGHTHTFLLTFASEEDRGIYLNHPDHADFGDLARPHIKTITVTDYWT